MDVWRLHKLSSHVITTLPDGLAWQLLMHRAAGFIRVIFSLPLSSSSFINPVKMHRKVSVDFPADPEGVRGLSMK